MRVLELFSGTGTVSAAFRRLGHETVTVDIDAGLRPDIAADIRELPLAKGIHFDVIWASPPCTEFTKADLPWYQMSNPDKALFLAALRIIKHYEPTYWIIENVRGAVPFFSKYIGPPRRVISPFYLWGFFPELGPLSFPRGIKTANITSRRTRARDRGAIPVALADRVAHACTTQGVLL